MPYIMYLCLVVALLRGAWRMFVAPEVGKGPYATVPKFKIQRSGYVFIRESQLNMKIYTSLRELGLCGS